MNSPDYDALLNEIHELINERLLKWLGYKVDASREWLSRSTGKHYSVSKHLISLMVKEVKAKLMEDNFDYLVEYDFITEDHYARIGNTYRSRDKDENRAFCLAVVAMIDAQHPVTVGEGS